MIPSVLDQPHMLKSCGMDQTVQYFEGKNHLDCVVTRALQAMPFQPATATDTPIRRHAGTPVKYIPRP